MVICSSGYRKLIHRTSIFSRGKNFCLNLDLSVSVSIDDSCFWHTWFKATSAWAVHRSNPISWYLDQINTHSLQRKLLVTGLNGLLTEFSKMKTRRQHSTENHVVFLRHFSTYKDLYHRKQRVRAVSLFSAKRTPVTRLASLAKALSSLHINGCCLWKAVNMREGRKELIL